MARSRQHEYNLRKGNSREGRLMQQIFEIEQERLKRIREHNAWVLEVAQEWARTDPVSYKQARKDEDTRFLDDWAKDNFESYMWYKLATVKREAPDIQRKPRESNPEARHRNALRKATDPEAFRLRKLSASLVHAKLYPERIAGRNKQYQDKVRQATPAWADHEKIAMIYAEASMKGMVVDHILPLRGATVSGLHVHENMRIISRSENSSKGNRYEV